MKTGEIWFHNDFLILIGKKKPNDIWMVAPFGVHLGNLNDSIKHIRSRSPNYWVFNEISGNDIRRRYQKLYEDQL